MDHFRSVALAHDARRHYHSSSPPISETLLCIVVYDVSRLSMIAHNTLHRNDQSTSMLRCLRQVAKVPWYTLFRTPLNRIASLTNGYSRKTVVPRLAGTMDDHQARCCRREGTNPA